MTMNGAVLPIMAFYIVAAQEQPIVSMLFLMKKTQHYALLKKLTIKGKSIGKNQYPVICIL